MHSPIEKKQAKLEADLKPWLKVPEFQRDEDIASLVVRMAPMGLMKPKDFAFWHFGKLSVAKVAFSRLTLERLTQVGGYSMDALTHNYFHAEPGVSTFRGIPFPRRWIAYDARRVAPRAMLSMGDVAYTKSHWRFRVFPCDLDTGERLIEICPSCHEQLNWHQVGKVHECHCGFDLREIEPRYVSQDELDNTVRLARIIGVLTPDQPIQLPEPFNELTRSKLLYALEWCGRLSLIAKGKLYDDSRTDAAHYAIDVLRTWPETIDSLIRYMPLSHGRFFPREIRSISSLEPKGSGGQDLVAVRRFVRKRIFAAAELRSPIDRRWMNNWEYHRVGLLPAAEERSNSSNQERATASASAENE